MKRLVTAALLSMAAATAQAESDDIVRVESSADVATTMDRLEAAVTAAGASVVARVDHAAGAASADMALPPAQLLIFGNPKIGTPAMQDDPLAGLFLPLKVLVYRDGAGQIWLAYQDPAEMLADLAVPAEAGYVDTMSGALAKLTGKAARE